VSNTVSSTLALLVTAGVGIASSLIVSWTASRRQQQAQESARRREERDHLRTLFEDGSAALRSAFRVLKPDVIPRPTVEQVGQAIGDVMAVSDRLALYLPDDHPASGAYTRTTAALYGLSGHSSKVYPAGTPRGDQTPEAPAKVDGISNAEHFFFVSLDAYNDACRGLLRG
jgi:hypothetical protein